MAIDELNKADTTTVAGAIFDALEDESDSGGEWSGNIIIKYLEQLAEMVHSLNERIDALENP